eukprot:TRINITY_DN9060_c1_g2_i1.p1 TRINITY_DN9060_c1_g2~~TRINITY_DN9060_c1_g2_i1.p1  ORF type:complete len:131 (+),score=9.60 TRINITY_DN9060_c1_g2_i1:53-445(+)
MFKVLKKTCATCINTIMRDTPVNLKTEKSNQSNNPNHPNVLAVRPSVTPSSHLSNFRALSSNQTVQINHKSQHSLLLTTPLKFSSISKALHSISLKTNLASPHLFLLTKPLTKNLKFSPPPTTLTKSNPK